MPQPDYLVNFFQAIEHDPRIGSTHICMFTTLFYLFKKNEDRNPVRVNRASAMKAAKISGIATYHKCITDLVYAGYIIYIPSFHPGISTSFILRDIE